MLSPTNRDGRSPVQPTPRVAGPFPAPAATVEAVLNRLPDGIILLDAQGAVCFVNRAARAFCGLAEDSVGAGVSFGHLQGASSLDWSELNEFYGAGRAADCLTTGEDGRSALLSLRFLRDPDARADFAILVLRDLDGIERIRRRATGDAGDETFRFAASQQAPPDFHAQRRVSRSLDRAITLGARAMAGNARLLLSGESGTGKTELAKFLHRQTVGAKEPLIHVNCGSIPETLFEAEMFGHEKGAFTGATATGRRGHIEAAEGGTLFLDEIGEMPLAVQTKLLKFLDDGRVQRIGGHKPRRINCRIISATNQDLWRLVEAGRFRADLYYRLAVFPIELAPLREEPALVALLIEHFLRLINRGREKPVILSADCRRGLLDYGYPGNIRELQNILTQLAVLVDGEATLEDLPRHVLSNAAPCRPPADGIGATGATGATGGMKEQVRAFERGLIEDAIERHGSKRQAAKALGVDIGTIVRKTRGTRVG